MKQNWWKIAGSLLVVFSLIAGLQIRVKPGLLNTVSDHASTSEAPFKVSISGYNTNFTQAENQIWLVNDTLRKIKTCASKITVTDDQHIIAEFPPVAPAADPVFGLAVYNSADGLLFKPSAINTTDTFKAVIVQSCTPKVDVNAGAQFAFPFRYVLYESIRNLFFHVPMWFCMIAMLTWSVFNHIRYLRTFNAKYDVIADQTIRTAILFGILGLITGSVWARVTWGAWWVDDVKLNGAAITMLAYLAYVVLRSSMEDKEKRARIGAIYSIFAYVMMIALLGILPRLKGTDTLHPGNGGNPGFNQYDLDSTMRPVFYSAVAGWIIIGLWIAQIRTRIYNLKEAAENQ
jgi:heme exporter protein C